jgi:hypothetical protein
MSVKIHDEGFVVVHSSFSWECGASPAHHLNKKKPLQGAVGEGRF